MKKRSLLISFLSVCMAICVCFGLTTAKNDLVARADEGDAVDNSIHVTITADDAFTNVDDTSPNAFYFRANENSAPIEEDAWATRYRPLTADAVKLIRNGETFNVGNTGSETLVKYGASHYYVEGWAIGANDNGWQNGDVYVFNGDFYREANDATITFVNVAFEITIDGEGRPKAIEYIPSIKAGKMYSHQAGFATENGNVKGVYFTMAENEAPYDASWVLEYMPLSADNCKFFRDGETISVGKTGLGFVVKFGPTDYYLKLEGWMIGDAYPLREGDLLIVGGKFEKNGVIFEIEETTIEIFMGVAYFDSEDVEKPTVVNAGYGMQAANTDNAYFDMAENEATYDDEWDFRYMPTTADAIKRIRNGETSNVAIVGNRTIVKHSNINYFLEFSQMGGYQEGDIVILDGKFISQDKKYILSIEETYFRVGANGCLTVLNPNYVIKIDGEFVGETGVLPYGTTVASLGELEDLDRPEDEDFTYEFIGWYVGEDVFDANRAYEGTTVITPKYNRTAKNAVDVGYGYLVGEKDNFYFNTVANDLPFLSDWSLRYRPMTEDSVRRIRGGVTTNVARVGAELIVKYSESEYFFACEGANLTDVSVQDGDIFVLDGWFNYVDGEGVKHVLEIQETYIHVAIVDGAKVITVLNPAIIFANEDGSVYSATAFAKDSVNLAVAPADPVKTVEHYEITFDGWYAGEDKWDFATGTVSEVVVLTPKFNVVPVNYVVTFVNGDQTVSEVTYTVETETIEVPEVPESDEDGYVYVWEDFVLVPGGMTVNAIRRAVEYTATFVVDGETVEEITYTVETEDIVAPAVPERTGYEGAWESYELTVGGVTVNAVYTAIEYTATFMADDVVVAEITFTVETISEVEFPLVPEKEGYDGAWDKALEDLGASDIVITAVYTEKGGEEESESEVESETESEVESEIVSSPEESLESGEEGEGCFGGVGASSVLSILGLVAVAIIRKRR